MENNMKYQSESIEDILPAFVNFQKSMSGVVKNMNNPYFKSNYADLKAILETIKEPLEENSLTLMQTYEYHEGNCFLTTTLYHETGQFFRSYAPLPIDKNPQAFGSYSTYLRRYSLAALLGIYQKDDDGNEAAFISDKQYQYILSQLSGFQELRVKVMEKLAKNEVYDLKHIPPHIYESVVSFITEEKKKQVIHANN